MNSLCKIIKMKTGCIINRHSVCQCYGITWQWVNRWKENIWRRDTDACNDACKRHMTHYKNIDNGDHCGYRHGLKQTQSQPVLVTNQERSNGTRSASEACHYYCKLLQYIFVKLGLKMMFDYSNHHCTFSGYQLFTMSGWPKKIEVGQCETKTPLQDYRVPSVNFITHLYING